MIPTKPGYYWCKPTDRHSDGNFWQPCKLESTGLVWLMGTDMYFSKERYEKWEWGAAILHGDEPSVHDKPNGQTWPL